jgi:hypothetical protein
VDGVLGLDSLSLCPQHHQRHPPHPPHTLIIMVAPLQGLLPEAITQVSSTTSWNRGSSQGARLPNLPELLTPRGRAGPRRVEARGGRLPGLTSPMSKHTDFVTNQR